MLALDLLGQPVEFLVCSGAAPSLEPDKYELPRPWPVKVAREAWAARQRLEVALVVERAEEGRRGRLAALREGLVQVRPGREDDESALDVVLLVAGLDAVVGLKSPLAVSVTGMKSWKRGLVDEHQCFWGLAPVRDGEELLGTKAGCGDLFPRRCLVLLGSFSWKLGEVGRVVGSAVIEKQVGHDRRPGVCCHVESVEVCAHGKSVKNSEDWDRDTKALACMPVHLVTVCSPMV